MIYCPIWWNMAIIARYIIKEICKYFSIILVVVLGIYLTVDFIEKVDNFLEAGVPVSRAFLYLAYKLPLIVVQMTPLGVLLAVLITFGLMGKNNELVALRSGGISLASLAGPIFRCGVGATVFMILLAEVAAPMMTDRANRIWLQEVRKENITTTGQKDIWLKGDQEIIHISLYDPETAVAKGITVNRFDRKFRLIERVDARQGTIGKEQWSLEDGILQQYNPDSGHMNVLPFAYHRIQEAFSPENLSQVAPRADEMSFMQLYRYIKRVEGEGYDAGHYRVDLQTKIAFPFLCIIMSLMGAGLAAGGKIREGLAISITYGIGIAFFYWIVFSFCVSLGYAGMLPPFVAAWGVNVIFICFAGYLLLNAD